MKNCRVLVKIFFGFYMGYGVTTACFLTTIGTQNNEKSYHDQSLLRLQYIGENLRKYIKLLLWNSMSNLELRFFLRSVYHDYNFLARLGQRHCVRRPSSVCRPSTFANIFLSEASGRIEAKFQMEPHGS